MLGAAVLFALVALLYATVGFGGGSTYNALLVLSGTDFRAIPTISLLCNIVVVGLGAWRFSRDGYVRLRRIWPLFTFSVPMAWLGGRQTATEAVFVGALALTLFASGLALFWQANSCDDIEEPPSPSLAEPVIGGVLGFVSGFVGIGGGVFLAPLLHFWRWGRTKVIAGTCAVFILVNSIAGLAGQFSKRDDFDRLGAVSEHWPLLPAVVLGGFLGSLIGSSILKPRAVRVATATLILIASVNLGLRFKAMLGAAT